MSSYGMGQNFNPHTIRIGINKKFDSKWYDENISQKEKKEQSIKNERVKDCEEER